MKQVIQSFRTGQVSVEDIPAPQVRASGIQVQTAVSLVSAGTERMVATFAEKNLIDKARSRPDLVKQVIDKAKREGILTTIESVRNRLDQPLPLGYSAAGTVIQVGAEASAMFSVGDRVACAGSGMANHAQVISLPRTLAAQIPNTVSFEHAAFSTLGAIAIQGIRQAEVHLGHTVAIIGLGLLGQLTAQLLQAAGCRVIGLDPKNARAQLALELGCLATETTSSAFVPLVQKFTIGRGADAVIITADTASDQPIDLAGEIARDRAIVVAVGAVGLNVPRKRYYEKELDLRLSRSYGPGRYDPSYEEDGHDYPVGYVRFTQQRNIETFLGLLAERKLSIDPLISHRFPIDDAAQAYDLITGKTSQPFLGVLITYPIEASDAIAATSVSPGSLANLESHASRPLISQIKVGVLGAGNFLNTTLLPVMKAHGSTVLDTIVSGSGITAQNTAKRFGFRLASSDSRAVLNEHLINAVVIATRHNLHAAQVMAALRAGKHVFCEKPLCLTLDELSDIVNTYESLTHQKPHKNPLPILHVGFNRRWAPYICELKEHLAKIREPLLLNFRANAGFIPSTHWTQDLTVGGGRLLGEACHFIDLLIFLAGSVPKEVRTTKLTDNGRYSGDNFHLTLLFANGSVGTLTYSANGDKSLGKEFLEVFGGGLSARMDDFRSLLIIKDGKKILRNTRMRIDKGHQACWAAFADSVSQGGHTPIPIEELILSTRATLAAHASMLAEAPVLLT
jgi:predicted dehydrogenase/threonine dehydrogenase-like Zn-dependent dehydrogenase